MKRPYASPIARSVGKLGLLAVLATAASVGCQQPAGRHVPVLASARCGQADDAAMRRLMERRNPEVNLEGESFRQVIEYLRALTDANIEVNWTALEFVGIEPDIEVRCRLKDVTFAGALRTILDFVGAGETELDYDFTDNILQISTKEDLSRHTCSHIYDVRDLLAGRYAARVYDGLPDTGAHFSASTPTFDSSPATSVGLVEYRGPDALMLLIQGSIEPESWRSAGGNVGSIAAYGNTLVVVQTHSAHRQIEELLAMLRQALLPGMAIEYTPIPPRPPAAERPPRAATTRPTGMR